ncbi:DinB family protein [Hymenobacter metallicola]|uniref:DinB family protein n=1 Tax=Hymenobacter metallicola TaxID=2563114 RepID=A0A4Z0QFA9_9BACT|nr:DinB family protein [Hymenobacter metallicola]TGE28136.1 DinB family protein [Hymenobacter metallicola]
MDHTTRNTLVAELTALLRKGYAHASLEEACANLPLPLVNQPVPQVPYTIWQLAEHLRIAQWDILEFSRNPDYASPEWPEGYWPSADPVDEATWQATLASLTRDREAFIALLQDPSLDLLASFPHGTGQSLLREAMLIADHNSYHMGQLILVRRLLGAWE